MICKNLNGIIDKVSALIIYQSKRTPKLCENEFIDEFSYHSYYIGAQCFCFHPFGCVVGYYQNVFIFYIPIYGFDWANKIQSPLHEGFY